MRFIVLLIVVFGFYSAYAQDDKTKNPTVELPDFVITGKSQLNIKKVDKIKPDFISSINEDFVKPSYSPEALKVCLLYTSDAADERSSVDLGGRRIIKKKKKASHLSSRTSEQTTYSKRRQSTTTHKKKH